MAKQAPIKPPVAASTQAVFAAALIKSPDEKNNLRPGAAVVDSAGKTPPRAWLMLAVVYVAALCAPLAQFKVSGLASWLIPVFDLNGVSFGYLMSSLAIVGVVLSFPASIICRWFGLKATVLVSVACVGIGGLIAGTTDTFEIVLVSRVVEGIGVGLIGVAAPTCVAVWFPERTRGLAFGFLTTWYPMGTTLILLIAPRLAVTFGHQAVNWSLVVFCILAFVVFLSVFRLPAGVNGHIGSDARIAQNIRFLKNRNIWLLGLAFFVFNLITLGIIKTHYNTFLETARGIAPTAAASILSVQTALGIILAPIAGLIFDHVSRRRKRYLLVIPFAIFLVASVFPWFTGDSANVTMWLFIALAGLAAGFGAGVLRPTVPLLMRNSSMGVAMGMATLQFFQFLGPTIGPPLFGAAYESFGWQMAGYLIMLPICAMAVILMLSVRVPEKEEFRPSYR